MDNEDIKNYDEKINKIIYFDISIALILFSPQFFSDTEQILKIISILINYGIPLSLRDVFNSKYKEIILFPNHWKNPKVGSRIFTEITENLTDERIDIEILEEKYGTFPKKPSEQNRLWYKIYLEYKDEDQIFNSKQAYLYHRDVTTILFMILNLSIINIILQFFYKIHINYFEKYVFFLFIQFSIFWIAGRNKSELFAYDVLAIASQKNK